MRPKIKVLMVDDEDKFRETSSKILERKGFQTTMAANGEEAIRIIEKDPQDVVVLDIKMPGMDGHTVLSKLKSIAPDTRVIMLTGHGGQVSAKISLELGAFDYLNKPCDIDLLATKIKNAVESGNQNIRSEKQVRDIMIHISDYTTITEDKTIKEAILHLMRSFDSVLSSSKLLKIGHRSILVFDQKNEKLTGILSIVDLIGALRPAYLSMPKPSMAESIQYSPMFWSGLFTSQAQSMGKMLVSDIMSEEIPYVQEDTNLMELADIMYQKQIRRMIVLSGRDIVGVVREQELFFEIANTII
ncbi:MAG: response regulator [Candidatus Magnetomorum sp.]|nr:response regulator [Candidatus Magnetomorum sp.]